MTDYAMAAKGMVASALLTQNYEPLATTLEALDTATEACKLNVEQVKHWYNAHTATEAALDAERTRADEAEKRERELREALTLAANRMDCCVVDYIAGGSTDAQKVAEWADAARKSALIQPEPDPLVEAIEAMRQTAKELRECPNRDCNLVMQAIMWEKRAADVEARLSIVKGESL